MGTILDYKDKFTAEIMFKINKIGNDGHRVQFNISDKQAVTILYGDEELGMQSYYFNTARRVVSFMANYLGAYIKEFFKRVNVTRLRLASVIEDIREYAVKEDNRIHYSNLPTIEQVMDIFEKSNMKYDFEPIEIMLNEIHAISRDCANMTGFYKIKTRIKENWAKNCIGYQVFRPSIIAFTKIMENDYRRFNLKEDTIRVFVFGFVNHVAALLLTIEPDAFILNKLASRVEILNEFIYLKTIPDKENAQIANYEEIMRDMPLNEDFSLRGTQGAVLSMIYEHFLKKHICLLCADPGFGKTTISLIFSHMLIGQKRRKRQDARVVIVSKSSNIVPQWKAQFEALNMQNYYQYFLWVKSEDKPETNVSMMREWNKSNIEGKMEYLKTALSHSQFVFLFENRLSDIPPLDTDLLVYDECHQSITTTTSTSMARCRADNMLLVSATPGANIKETLSGFSPDFTNLTSRYRPYTLEVFDTLFNLDGIHTILRNYAYNLQFAENNIYYNMIVAERIWEYVSKYKGVPKIIVFVNNIIHAYLLEYCLKQKNVSTTLYIQSDTVCDGNATVMIGTRNKVSTGFDQSNSAVKFNHKFNTAVIAMSVSDPDLFYQMLGRIMRNDVESEELRVIYCKNTMTEKACENIVANAPAKTTFTNTLSNYGPIHMNVYPSYTDSTTIEHGLLPTINKRTEPTNIVFWQSEEDCQLETYDRELRNLRYMYNHPNKIPPEINFEKICMCACKYYDYTTAVREVDDDDEGFVTCPQFCISYIRSMFCYSINCKKNITKPSVLPDVTFDDMLKIFPFDKLIHKHKQVDSRTQVKTLFSTDSTNYLGPNKGKVGFNMFVKELTADKTEEGKKQQLDAITATVPRNLNKNTMLCRTRNTSGPNGTAPIPAFPQANNFAEIPTVSLIPKEEPVEEFEP